MKRKGITRHKCVFQYNVCEMLVVFIGCYYVQLDAQVITNNIITAIILHQTKISYLYVLLGLSELSVKPLMNNKSKKKQKD